MPFIHAYVIFYLAWVLGGADPISGTVSLHEVIRGFGALLKKGWKPLRTGNAHHSVAPVVLLISNVRSRFCELGRGRGRYLYLNTRQMFSNQLRLRRSTDS